MDGYNPQSRSNHFAEMDKIRAALASMVPEGEHYESVGRYVNTLIEAAAGLPNPGEHLDALKEFLVLHLTAKATEGGKTDVALLAHINAKLTPVDSPAGSTTHTTGAIVWPPVGPHNSPPSMGTRHRRYT